MACLFQYYLTYSLRSNSFSIISRLYSKTILRRKPVKVLNLPQRSLSPIDERFGKTSKILSMLGETSLNIPKEETSHLMVPPYEKLKKNDSRFTKVLTSIKSRKLRERKNEIMLEGKRLINDAIDAGIELKTIYFCREKDLACIHLKTLENVEFLKVFYKSMSIWSDLTTSPGLMGVFKKPTAEMLQELSHPVLPVTILCDNIREPGNLGSVIRNAAAAGCENILLTKGCVDPWELKVLRSGCGGHFRIPIINNIEWIHLSNYLPKQPTIFIADSSSNMKSTDISPEYVYYDEISDDREEEEEEKYISMEEDNHPVAIDETYDKPSELEKFENVSLPSYLYSSVEYPKENIVLYIGGETHGVNPRVLKLACDNEGKRVKIPLENGMESLNSSFAMTIVLYEIKRQLAAKYVTN